jgi:hypothetical protein
MGGGGVLRAATLGLLSALLAAGLLPQAVSARPGSSKSFALDYAVTAIGSLDATLRTLDLSTTLTITAPAGGLSSLMLGVVPRGFGAWTSTGASVDGSAAEPAWVNTIGMAFDLSADPWVPGSVHEVVVDGVIDFAASTATNARLRRVGTGSGLTLTAGDFLPLPVATARWPVYADPGNAATARSISFTLNSATVLPDTGVVLAGEQSTVSSGSSWTATIAPARSFAFALSPSFVTSTTSPFTLAGPDGAAQSVRVVAVGSSSAVRTTDRMVGAGAVKSLWSKFGPGPYTRYKIVRVPIKDAAHEFAGIVFVGSVLTVGTRTTVIRHEMAHQWWYGLVDTDQNADPWMDEALAEWSAQRIAGATASSKAANCTRKIDGPAYSASGYYTAKFGANSFHQCVYLRGANAFFALGSVMGGQTRLEACLKRYAQAHRFGAPGPVVLAQAIRDCNERTLATLTKYLSAATVNATR